MTRFVADSSCEILEIPGVDFVPVPLTIYNDDISYCDDEQMDVGDMLERFAHYKGRTYTACPSVDAWLQAFEGADTIYVAAMTSTLSGTYNSAMTAKNIYCQEHPEARVHVFDSLTTGPELHLLVEKLVELDREGLPFEEVCRRAEHYSKRCNLFFALRSLHNLSQNGRVSKLVASAVEILGISILCKASEEGDIEPVFKCRGERKVISKILEQLESVEFSGGKIRLTHVENLPLAEKLADAIRSKYPKADIKVYRAGGLCSYYSERGGILLGCD